MKYLKCIVVITLITFFLLDCDNSFLSKSNETDNESDNESARYVTPYLLQYKTIKTTNEIWPIANIFSCEFDGPGATEFYCIGSLLMKSAHSGSITVVFPIDPTTIANPIDYTMIWNDRGSGIKFYDISVWHPIAPVGYVAMGDLAVRGYSKPSLKAMVCIRDDLVTIQPLGNQIWNDRGSGANLDFSGWSAGNNLFFGNNSYVKPNRFSYSFNTSMTYKLP